VLPLSAAAGPALSTAGVEHSPLMKTAVDAEPPATLHAFACAARGAKTTSKVAQTNNRSEETRVIAR
jgi:hypothetical protein